MNFLAHAYLSFNNPSIIIGNMIADFVKGKQILQHTPAVQEGIRIHRAIDTFTDQHTLTKEGRELFKPSCGLYGAVFMDIVYDHFLARDLQRFTDVQLEQFAQSIYTLLENNADSVPPVFLQVFHYMRTQNWLYNYRLTDGIYRTFSGITRRARYLEVPASVPFAVFEEHYNVLENCYQGFFPELEVFVKEKLALLP